VLWFSSSIFSGDWWKKWSFSRPNFLCATEPSVSTNSNQQPGPTLLSSTPHSWWTELLFNKLATTQNSTRYLTPVQSRKYCPHCTDMKLCYSRGTTQCACQYRKKLATDEWPWHTPKVITVAAIKWPFEFCHDLWHQKTRVPELSCGIICVILCLAVLTQYRSVTHRQTHDNSIYRASIASHDKNDNVTVIQWWHV